MREHYCDYCKKKMNSIPTDEASTEWHKGYNLTNPRLSFAVEVKVSLCTGMDICCSCAEKATRMALTDKDLQDKLVRQITRPEDFYVRP